MIIWMDGRAHPSKNAPHDQQGFTTGVWNGNELIATTTHIKTGYIRRNGAPSSDEATITTHFRRHGDLLTVALFMDDPVYLTEPYVLTRSYSLSTGRSSDAYIAKIPGVKRRPLRNASGACSAPG